MRLGLLDRILRKIFRAQDIMPRMPKYGEVKFMSVFKTFWISVKKFPISFGLAVSMMIVWALLGLLVPSLVRSLVDTIGLGASNSDNVSKAFDITRTILFVGLGFVVVQRTVYYALTHLTRGVMVDLSERIYAALCRHEYRYFSNSSSGALFQKVNRFPASYDTLMDSLILTLIPLVISTIGAIVILAREQIWLSLIIFVWACLFVCYSIFGAKWKVRYDLVRASEDSKTGATMSDLITNQFAIDTHGSQEEALDRFRYSIRRKMHVTAFCWNTGVTLWGVSSIMTRFAEFAIYSLSVWLWSRGTFSAGLMFQSILYTRMLTDQLNEVDKLVRVVYEQFANASEAVEILEREPVIKDALFARKLVVSDAVVSFKDVCFALDERPIIRGISLEVRAGERIAFVGRSGAGKSTLTKLLLRLFDIDFGTIQIDGQDVSKVTLKSLRSAVSYVPQEPTLFTSSVMENIRFGRPSASDDEVLMAAKLAHCDEFVLRMPRGYDTPVGERGVKLSGGERQRVAIARALLRNASILICDEATSALDSESEAHIKAAFAYASSGRTSFFIAHRLSTIMDVDRICVIDEGRIAEMGSHSELIEIGGIYADLWRRQQEGFVPGSSETIEALFKPEAADGDGSDEPPAGAVLRIIQQDARDSVPSA